MNVLSFTAFCVNQLSQLNGFDRSIPLKSIRYKVLKRNPVLSYLGNVNSCYSMNPAHYSSLSMYGACLVQRHIHLRLEKKMMQHWRLSQLMERVWFSGTLIETLTYPMMLRGFAWLVHHRIYETTVSLAQIQDVQISRLTCH